MVYKWSSSQVVLRCVVLRVLTQSRVHVSKNVRLMSLNPLPSCKACKPLFTESTSLVQLHTVYYWLAAYGYALHGLGPTAARGRDADVKGFRRRSIK